MSLREVFCQDRAIGVLQRGFAADKSAHAYIFAGLEGVGKYKTAREWARLLLCKNPTCSAPAPGGDRASKCDSSRFEPSRGRLGYIDQSQPGPSEPFADSCGSCESCTLFDAGTHPDYAHIYKELVEFTKDGKDRKTPIDLPIAVIREFLIDQVALRPSLSARRAFVVSEAEKLNINSQNALLKVLEEPPHYCTIILLCTRLERLLPTIKSRCQIVRFGPVDEVRIVSRLTEVGVGREPATFFARLAQGSLGLACQWARLEPAGVGLFEIKRNAITSLARLEMADALDMADQLVGDARKIAAGWADLDETTSKSDLNRRAQKTLIQILISALRDVMMLSLGQKRPLINADQAREMAALASRLDSERAIRGITEGYEMLRWIEASVNERLIFDRLLLRLAPSAIIARTW